GGCARSALPSQVLVGGDAAVGEGDDAVGALGGVPLMGDHHDGLVELVHAQPQEVEHLLGGAGVEVAGGLVGEDDRGGGDQGAGDRDALHLAAGELRGEVREPVGDAEGGGDRLQPCPVRARAGELERQQDVLLGRQHRQQVEGLEDEADLLPPQLGERIVAEGGDLGAVQQDRTGVDHVEPGEDVQQRGLAGAGGTHDRREGAAGDVEVHRIQGGDGTGAGAVGPGDAAGDDGGGGAVRG